jgi:hypothetical protein
MTMQNPHRCDGKNEFFAASVLLDYRLKISSIVGKSAAVVPSTSENN